MFWQIFQTSKEEWDEGTGLLQTYVALESSLAWIARNKMVNWYNQIYLFMYQFIPDKGLLTETSIFELNNLTSQKTTCVPF